MANFININKTVRIEAQGTHNNGNCKAVVCVTNPAFYTSITDAAEAAGVTIGVMSNHVRGDYKTCKGNIYMFADDPRVVPAMAQQIAKRDKEISYMESKQSKMDELEAKAKAYDKLMAEQEAKRKAEERRLEMERKAKEEHEKAVAKAKDRVARYEAEFERRKAKLTLCGDKLMAAQIELEALLDKEV